MKIFIIIVFGLATLRTLTPFAGDDPYKSLIDFIASLFVAGITCYAYIKLLKLLVI